MTDKRGTKILARTFFNQLRATGYTSHQIIAIATELLDQVTVDIREQDKPTMIPVAAELESRPPA